MQIFLVLIVTAQLWFFANTRFTEANFFTDQATTFQHLFLKDWDPAREVHAYPQPLGRAAVYTQSDFYEMVDFTIKGLAKVEDDGIGPLFRNSSLGLCVEGFATAKVSKDLVASLKGPVSTNCIFLTETEIVSFNSSLDWLANFPISWPGINRLFLNFSLTGLTLGLASSPTCFQYMLTLNLNNRDRDSQVEIDLKMVPKRLQCPGNSTAPPSPLLELMINLCVLATCLLSLTMCLRSLILAQLLRRDASGLLHATYGWILTREENLRFLNVWQVLVCINNLLIMVGTAAKQALEWNIWSDLWLWDTCGLFLGVGSLLAWCGLLRYLGLFKAYNVLILTMQAAAPNMIRFLLSASFIYSGFVLAGWAILGPHHFKFASLMSTSECLFSLINGDDMFATFNSIPMDDSVPVWIFSRLYLYGFICLFIYVVLSLFISIIMDTYEVVKNYYERGFPPSRLEAFYSSSRSPERQPGLLGYLWATLRRRPGYHQI